MERKILISIILDQREIFKNFNYIPRLKDQSFLNDPEIVVISGVRRCGKSTLLYEIRQNNLDKDYFINFDDERLIKFTLDDFQTLYEIFIELYGKQNTFYFDEIQNINGWERFVRRLYDQGNKIFITGSNASMLSKELGTHLTGRYYQFELLPFSFKEYLALKKVTYSELDLYKTDTKALLKSRFNEFFTLGGFPAYLQNENRSYLKSLYESILYRDVMVRNNLTNEREILELVYFLASNVAKLITYNSITSIINVQHATTAKNYLHHLENTYLIFLVNKFDYALKKQILSPKKVYLIDNAISYELGFHTSEDNGRYLENIVFLELKRRSKDIYYHKQKYECDFVIREKNRITQAIQVCWSVHDNETRDRELRGLREAMEFYHLDHGIILTENDDEIIRSNNQTIEIIPVWQWLLKTTTDL